jgi:hypothetical protein
MLWAMNKPNTLAAAVTRLSDDLLATISADDALILYEGLSEQAGQPDVDAALARLADYIWGQEEPACPTPPSTPRRVLH